MHTGRNFACSRLADETLHGVLRDHHLQRTHPPKRIANARDTPISVLLHFLSHPLQINATERLQG